MAINRDYIGATYTTDPYTITAEAAKAYALATNDPNPRYLDGAVAPPVFGVVFEYPAMLKTLFDSNLRVNMLRLVHGEHRMFYVRPLTPGLSLTTTAQVTDVEDKGSGEVLSITLTSRDAAGTVALFSRSSFFIRGESKGGGGAKAPKAPEAEKPAPAFTFSEQTTSDQALRYAEASGDRNPIHIDEETAKKAGLPRTILHGLCSMAFNQKHIVNTVCGGDPSKLLALGVRFSRPVLPGEGLTIRAWQGPQLDDRQYWTLETANDSGALVITDSAAQTRA
jgi:acyl dehydratase